MKRSLLLTVQEGTAKAREGKTVQRGKSRKGLGGGRESSMVMGLVASARREQLSFAPSARPWGFAGVSVPSSQTGAGCLSPSISPEGDGATKQSWPAQSQGMSS